MRKQILLAGTVLALGMSLMGCQKKEAAKEMILGTWEGMFPQEVLDGFEKETGIKLIYSNFDTDETMLEKLTQSEGKEYDLVIADDYIIDAAVTAGLVSKLDSSKIENYSDINPLFENQFYDKNNEYTLPYGAGIPLIVYDPKQVPFEITGYEDLWNPELAGSLALTANYRVINGITLLSMGKSMNTEDVNDIAAAGEKLKALAPNVRLIQDDNTQNSLLNGEAKAAFLYTSQVTAVVKENPELKVVFPKEGLGFGIMAAFVPSKAAHSEEALAFLNYIMKPENYKQCIEYVGYYSTNKAADSEIAPELVVPADASKGEIIQNVSEEADAAYNKNWTEFKAACN